jgi:hypothetical protein
MCSRDKKKTPMSHAFNKFKSDAKNGNFGLVRTASKTVRKFTQLFPENDLPQSVSVSLDWLAFTTECLLPAPVPDQKPIWLNDTTVLEYLKRGTQVYNYSYCVYIHGEPVANVHTHSKNEKIIKPGSAKLEILNHVLYSGNVLETLHDVMEACKMPVIKNVSRLDICIDGANHVHKFLNSYVRQHGNRSRPTLKTLGRWDKENRVRHKGKASIDCKRFDKSNGMFKNFKIGSTRKSFTLYNKTTELQRSHKQYIRDVWSRAGIDQTGDVWRCELRLTSQSVKEIKDFDLKKINDPNYLLQIFKTQCKNFFEFVLIENDENVSRARVIDLFQFEKLKVPLLEKIPRAIVRGAYKAQMAIHNAYKNILLGYHKTKESIDAALLHISDNLQLYNLDHWYEKKKPAWIEVYQPVKYFM